MNFSHQCCPLLNQIAAESSFYKSTPHDGYNVHADHLALFSLLSTHFGGGELDFKLPFYRFAPAAAQAKAFVSWARCCQARSCNCSLPCSASSRAVCA